MTTPTVVVFSKEAPCTKKEIWRCFMSATGFKAVDVPTAQSIIGANVPRVMERAGNLIKEKGKATDSYKLTEQGKAWLTEGINAYVKNHPSEASSIPFLPGAKRVRSRVAT